MADKKVSIGVTDIAFAAVSILFTIGILTFFAPCGPKEDGTWMLCHWAGRAVAGLSVVITVIALAHLFVKNQVKAGLDIAAIPVALLTAILPGNLINLCMMKTMKCHAVTHPATVIFSVLVIAAVVVDLIVQQKKK